MDKAYFDQFLSDGKIEDTVIKTSFGEIHAYYCRAESFELKTKHVILAMHGDGATSDNTGWIPILKPFSQAGYTMFSLSMPGYGKSTGDRYSFRSSGTHILNEIM